MIGSGNTPPAAVGFNDEDWRQLQRVRRAPAGPNAAMREAIALHRQLVSEGWDELGDGGTVI